MSKSHRTHRIKENALQCEPTKLRMTLSTMYYGVSARTPLGEQWDAFSHLNLLPPSPLTLSCTGDYAQSKGDKDKIPEPFDYWFISLWQSGVMVWPMRW